MSYEAPENITLPDEWLWLMEEFRKLANVLRAVDGTRLTLIELHQAPTKPRDGEIYFADGTDWDPGSGRGLYYYDGGYTFIA